LDILTKEGEAEGSVDIFSCVRNLREQRVKMVQSLVSLGVITPFLFVDDITFNIGLFEKNCIGIFIPKI
jgi:protein tyrosine phosphatase